MRHTQSSKKNEDFHKTMKKTNSNIELKNFYGGDPKPGSYPYTSGIYSNMYNGKLWTMRQYAGFTSALESNKRYRFLVDQGVMGLSVAFDLPTQTGYDSDHKLSLGEVGRVGVPICTIDDMDILLEELPLNEISISMTINSTAAVLLGFLIVCSEKRGINRSALMGTIQNDILKEYIARGTYIYPPKPSMRLITDIFSFCSQEMPKWNTISISGYHIREAGSTAVEELAFTFANGIAYVEAALEKGLDINIFGKRLSFFFNCHNHFFEEIAKFRAARRIWAKIMKERFRASDEKALMCRFHTQTAGSTLQAKQIDNNIVRTTLQATAAILGGTQSLHTNARDEALALPTEKSAQLALRTQQIIAYETGIPDVSDPLAGSPFIEGLTDEIEEKVMGLISKIDDLGGAVSAIEDNFQQNQIGISAYNYQKAIDEHKNILVGINKFQTTKDETSSIQKINKKEEIKQCNRLKIYKNNRNKEELKLALTKLHEMAQSSENLMPYIIDSIRKKATLGEISNTLRKVFGEY